MPKLFLQTMWLLLTTCFSSGNLEFWYKLCRGCLHDQTSVKTLGTGCLMSLSGRQHRTHGHKSTRSCMMSLVGGTLGACAWLPPDFSPCAFFLCQFCFTSFHCDKSSLYDPMLTPVSPQRISQNLGVVLGKHSQKRCICVFFEKGEGHELVD